MLKNRNATWSNICDSYINIINLLCLKITFLKETDKISDSELLQTCNNEYTDCINSYNNITYDDIFDIAKWQSFEIYYRCLVLSIQWRGGDILYRMYEIREDIYEKQGRFIKL